MAKGLNFQCIGLLYHPKVPQTRVMVAEMMEFIEGFGVKTWVGESWNADTVKPHIAETDVLVTLGGDGSLLRAARMALGHDAMVLGVNMGRIGFLAGVEPAEWMSLFRQMLVGSYWVEERLMLDAECCRQGRTQGRYVALNEVVVGRGGSARVVRLDTFINDSYLTTYTADGMILSTPTGSTAYALAAGGPILPPELNNYLMVPIAPHLSMDRAIIFSQGDFVRLTINSETNVVMSIDGQIDVPLEDGDSIEISVSAHRSRFLRLQDRTYFYRNLIRRLGYVTER